MQAGVGLLVTDVMPIYMIMPRYSHNYAQFCQLLNSNLFTHRRILMLLREATSETYGPRVYLHHINLPTLSCFLFILLCFYFTLHIYHKSTKNIVLSYLSDLTLVSDRVGIDNPLSRWLRGFICLCRCEGLVRGLLLDWYLGSQKLREILTLLCCITLSSSRENQRSAQEVARRISGAVAGESTQKSTYQVPITNPYLPHYIICHLPLVFLSPTSPLPFYSPSLSLSSLSFSICPFCPFAFCLLVC